MVRGFAEKTAQTHCLLGHAFTPDNTYSSPARPTSRRCRTCTRLRDRVRRPRVVRVVTATVEGMRTCSVCEQTKELHEFPTNGRWRRRTCKVCRNGVGCAASAGPAARALDAYWPVYLARRSTAA